MPPIFHSDIAEVEKLQAELLKLSKILKQNAKDEIKLATAIQKKTKATREELQAAEELAARHKKTTAAMKQTKDAIERLAQEKKEMNREGAARAKQMDREIFKEKELRKALNMEVKSIQDLMTKTNAMVAARKRLDLSTDKGRRAEKAYAKQIAANTTKLKRYDALIGRHQRNVGNYTKTLGGLKAGYIAVMAATVGAIAGLRRWINLHAELSDAMADVRKTTGLTWKEVHKLNKELLKINTRTSQKELLDLSFVAGKLGIEGSENILGFVRAADQIGVALGRELGDVEEATRVIGKLTELFDLKDEFGLEESMIKIGSAINSLGMASTASEGFLVEFTKRLGGIASQAKISVFDVLGLGSALDQLGQTSEVSSTALSQVIVKLFQNTSKFAKIAGLEVESFSRLLQTDANAAIVQFVTALGDNNKGMMAMAKAFDQMGLDGKRTIGVLSALATNIDVVTEAQELSNAEGIKATSIANEFAIKNDTLAASMERTTKAWTSFIQSEGVEKFLKNLYDAATVILGGAGAEIIKLQKELKDNASSIAIIEENNLWLQGQNLAALKDRNAEIKEELRIVKEIAEERKLSAERFAFPLGGKKDFLPLGLEEGGGRPVPGPVAPGKVGDKIVFEVSEEEKKRIAKLLAERKKADEEYYKFKKDLGLFTIRELYEADVKAITESKEFALLTDDEKQQALLNNKMEWTEKAINQEKALIKRMTGLGTSAAFPGLPKKLDKVGEDTTVATEILGVEADPENIFDTEKWKNTFTTMAGYAQLFGSAVTDVLDMVSQANKQKLEEEMFGVQQRYSFESEQLDKQLKNKTISQAEFDAKKLKLDKKLKADEDKLRKEFAKKEQQTAIIKAVINTAVGVTGSLAQGGILGIILAAITLALGIAEIATISSQKFAKGGHQELGKKGKTLTGKRHDQGGVDLGEVGTAEAGEYMGILSRQATSKYSDILPTVFDSLNDRSFENVFAMSPMVIKESKYQKKMYQEMTKEKTQNETTVTDTMIITRNGNHISKVYL